MKTIIEEEGNEGDEPELEDFDEEKENEETKKMKKGKEVSPRVGATPQHPTPARWSTSLLCRSSSGQGR